MNYPQEFINEDENKLRKQLRHYKYKRCLDKMVLCGSNVYYIRRIALRDMDEHTLWQYEDDFWQRWYERWLELAEKLRDTAR
jgi:hypothetical protein